MNPRLPASLRSLRVVLSAILLFGGLLIVLLALSFQWAEAANRANLRATEDLDTIERFVVPDLESALRQNDPRRLRAIMQSIVRQRHVSNAFLVDPLLRIVESSDPALLGRPLRATDLANLRSSVEGVLPRSSTALTVPAAPGHLVRVSPVRWRLASTELVAGRNGALVIDYDSRLPQDSFLVNLRRIALYGAVSILPTTLLLIFLVDWIIGRPLQRLAQFAQQGLDGTIQRADTRSRIHEVVEIDNALTLALEEAKRRLLALEASEQRFRNIVEGSSDWVFETSKTGEILFSNHGSKSIIGRSPDEILGTPIASYFRAQDALYLPPLSTNAINATNSSVELTTAHSDGSPRLTSLLIQPTQRVGASRVFHGICVDVTAQRRLEAMQRQSQKIEAVGQLAGGVAHDFNNVLTVMLGACEMLLLDSELGANQRDLVQEINDCCQRSAELTRRLLAFGRQQLTHTEVFDLRDVVNSSSSLLQRLVGGKTSIARDDCHEPLTVEADASQIEQVIVNLVINARDAMPKGGVITLTSKRDDQDAILEITDTGTGIPKRLVDKIFEPFFTTKGGKGTGLGLPTALGIIQEAGGMIEVDSEVGRGTRFVVRLPLHHELAHLSDVVVTNTADNARFCVLVVDDEARLRDLVADQLRSLGFRVVTAPGPLEALTVAAESSPDLALIDVILGQGSGLDLGRELVIAFPEMVVVFMSGFTAHLDPESQLKPGVNLLQKPFQKKHLAAFVDNALHQGAPRLGTGEWSRGVDLGGRAER